MTQVVINAAGTVTDQRDGYYSSTDYAWDPVHSRAFFFSQGISPNDLYYAVIVR